VTSSVSPRWGDLVRVVAGLEIGGLSDKLREARNSHQGTSLVGSGDLNDLVARVAVHSVAMKAIQVAVRRHADRSGRPPPQIAGGGASRSR